MGFVVGLLAGLATGSGGVSDVRQLSRSVVSASLQLGKHIEGGGVWRALTGSGASDGGATVLGEVVGKVALQPVASSNSASMASVSSSNGGLCIGVDFGDVFTVGSFELAESFGLFAGGTFVGAALFGQRCDGLGRFLFGVCQAQGLHDQHPKKDRCQAGKQQAPQTRFELPARQFGSK